MKRISTTLILVALFAAFIGPAVAVQPDEILADPALEARARTISKDLRCLVCQNQSIDDSDAGLARDLRVLVRERLVAGDSDQHVLEFVVARYGDFVLLDPPFKAATYVLWFGPVAIVLAAILAVVAVFRRQAHAPAPPHPLNDEERQLLAKLLKENSER